MASARQTAPIFSGPTSPTYVVSLASIIAL
jgi:hypothetical protein